MVVIGGHWWSLVVIGSHWWSLEDGLNVKKQEMKLEEFRVYQQSMEIGEEVWVIVMKWDYFAKDTVGVKLNNYINSIGKKS